MSLARGRPKASTLTGCTESWCFSKIECALRSCVIQKQECTAGDRPVADSSHQKPSRCPAHCCRYMH